MRRLRFKASASEVVDQPMVLGWTWVDRLPEALSGFSFVRDVHSGSAPGLYTLVLGPVGYGKVSMTLAMEMSVTKEDGRVLNMQSVPGRGNADAVVNVELTPTEASEQCILTISLDVSPHKPAASFWPRELIEKASSASLGLAARRMLTDMKAAIEGGQAAELFRARSEHPAQL